MNLVYITAINRQDESAGVQRKIDAQISAFEDSGFYTNYCNLEFDNAFGYKFFSRLPFYNNHTNWVINNHLHKADGIYIRRFILDSYMIDFFKKVKDVSQSKIVWEIPTYPYDSELNNSLKNYPLYLKDKYNRKKLKQFVDRIATLTDDDKIFDLNTIKIANGINLKRTSRRVTGSFEKKIVHMIAVARFSWWHGYDRFIEGLHNYYANGGKRNIVFHLVGDGTELPKYRALTAKYKLDSHVIFHGMQSGGALDEVYDQCSLGIGSLGAYRKGLNDTAELKTREYLAKGIAFICSAHILDIDSADEKDIYLRVPNNDSPIDIPSILAFYDRIYQEPETQVIARLRKYAEDHFSMDAAMKEVIDYFKSEEV